MDNANNADGKEVRYYLDIIKKAMEPKPDIKSFEPSYIVTAVKLPTGAIELIVNSSNIAEKIDYLLEAYDESMCLKANPKIFISNVMVV